MQYQSILPAVFAALAVTSLAAPAPSAVQFTIDVKDDSGPSNDMGFPTKISLFPIASWKPSKPATYAIRAKSRRCAASGLPTAAGRIVKRRAVKAMRIMAMRVRVRAGAKTRVAENRDRVGR